MPIYKINGFWAPLEYEIEGYHYHPCEALAERILIGGLYWGDMRIHADVEADMIEWIDDGLYALAEVFRDYDRAGGDWGDEAALRRFLCCNAGREYFSTVQHLTWLGECVRDYEGWVSGLMNPLPWFDHMTPPMPDPVDRWWRQGRLHESDREISDGKSDCRAGKNLGPAGDKGARPQGQAGVPGGGAGGMEHSVPGHGGMA